MIGIKRQLLWRNPSVPRSLPRIDQEIQRWKGTPYMAGQRSCQQAVDCVRFVEAFLEAMYQFKDSFSVEKVPQDASVHDPRTVYRVMAQMQRRYPHEIDARDELEPGDVIIINVGKGPGHSAIVGPRTNEVWHALPNVGVCMTGIGAVSDEDVAHTIHMLEKDKWV